MRTRTGLIGSAEKHVKDILQNATVITETAGLKASAVKFAMVTDSEASEGSTALCV